MEEKRLYRRSELSQNVKLSIVGNYGEGPQEPVEVEVTDVSSDGLGFICNEGLRIGELLTGKVVLWTKERVNVIVKIVRAKENEANAENGQYEYGCIFVGMEGNDSLRIKIYQLLERKQKEKERKEKKEKAKREREKEKGNNV
ncbi:MAG: PilZ domain-containing protein [Lachnospiraceae bacterium]|nr:PilZ domain-containing protein [Lachnospiraceae bacterium]